MKAKSTKERFEMKFVRGHYKLCWEWLASKTDGGYGKLMVDPETKKLELAHRLSYKFYVGEIPDGMIVRHKCDNPGCVNPRHLELGTFSDNTQDAVKRNRLKKRITPRGEANGKSKLTEGDVKKIRELKKGGLRSERIAQEFGVTSGHVDKICRYEIWDKSKLDGQADYLHSTKSQQVGDARCKVTPEMKERIIQLREQGMTHQQIGDVVGLTQGHVSVVLKKANGGKLQKERVSQEKIERILALRQEGLSQSVIGQMTGVAKSTVANILKKQAAQ